MTAPFVGAIGAIDAISPMVPMQLASPLPTHAVTTDAPGAGFGDMLMAGLRHVDGKVAHADALVRSFALDDGSVPVHQVTMALEDARMSVELAMQVRARLVEGFRELMNMQL